MNEHECFQRLIESTRLQIECCREMQIHQPEHPWLAIATKMEERLEMFWRLAEARAKIQLLLPETH